MAELEFKIMAKATTPQKKQYRSAAVPLSYIGLDITAEIVTIDPTTGKAPSETIPDQAMSVREILHKYTSGQSLDVNNLTPVYLENVSLYDTRRKHEIDLAVDKLQHERELIRLDKKVYDNKTALSELEADQKAFLQAQKQQTDIENPASE